jgi:two-component system chemotaxis response regulator CheY
MASPKILIVDDSETLRVQLRKHLEDSGFLVIEGFDGIDGLEKLKQEGSVDMIICDVNMPRMNGLTMLSHVRQEAAWKSVPILMLTTEARPQMKNEAKTLGVKAWVTKPYLADKLLNAVKKILAIQQSGLSSPNPT